MLGRAAAWSSTRQAIKTSVAGLISLLVTNLFHLPQGYWAAITALIVMQSNVGATVSASRTRLAGTAVGAVVGGVFMAIFGAGLTAFALAVAVAFFVCDSLRLAESQRLATVTVAIIMVIPRPVRRGLSPYTASPRSESVLASRSGSPWSCGPATRAAASGKACRKR